MASASRSEGLGTQEGIDELNSRYYADLTGQPKLIARNEGRVQQVRHLIPNDGESWGGPMIPAPKAVFAIGRGDFNQILKDGLKKEIVDVLQQREKPLDWISVDFVRIGYNHTDRDDNPIVILITVTPNAVTKAEGVEIVLALEEKCIERDLPEVRVEIKEGHRSRG